MPMDAESEVPDMPPGFPLGGGGGGAPEPSLQDQPGHPAVGGGVGMPMSSLAEQSEVMHEDDDDEQEKEMDDLVRLSCKDVSNNQLFQATKSDFADKVKTMLQQKLNIARKDFHRKVLDMVGRNKYVAACDQARQAKTRRKDNNVRKRKEVQERHDAFVNQYGRSPSDKVPDDDDGGDTFYASVAELMPHLKPLQVKSNRDSIAVQYMCRIKEGSESKVLGIPGVTTSRKGTKKTKYAPSHVCCYPGLKKRLWKANGCVSKPTHVCGHVFGLPETVAFQRAKKSGIRCKGRHHVLKTAQSHVKEVHKLNSKDSANTKIAINRHFVCQLGRAV
eukprot:CAMPEP_0114511160 /NCGR_PEP_ID=MMETSP0109-20121206/14199_1 /TAXON_ID=29199 /ORGANISM="Chlorarachnion reptans, Strain CCCM449" /LENGTH=331 /DNA_ID=CAMNT_0001690569 /DNA_START=188 /DNA_END=1180 /DNA_ORIENTATION=+